MYSSTHLAGDVPPPPPDRSKGYVWALYRDFDVFVVDPQGKHTRIVDNDGYDAEATISPDGKRIIFTSHRGDDVALYTCDPDGGNVKRVSQKKGYSGGGVFSPDGQWIAYRSFYPRTADEQTEFERLLKERTLHPVNLEVYVSRVDGSDARALTSNGKVNFAPAFHPDGKRVIYCGDADADPKAHGQYNLYLVGVDGKNPERVTFHAGFDGFPFFSPDGKYLVWISNRGGKDPRKDLNIFIAEWVD